ncbi:MAG: hypothetical protein N2378_07725 [Chloroflexaceae bacterium]|nr:hypothetical protein [Chloroflexaceae bacterium]
MTAAAIAVLFGGVYLASSILGFVMLAVFFALLCHPIRVWLVRRGLASSVALTIIAAMAASGLATTWRVWQVRAQTIEGRMAA